MSDTAEECSCPEPEAGIPAWVMTFADLMSLLMCFFVLLLSFSEMDALKFKRLAGSMAEAFGVQAEVKADNIPKGTSIIAQEFSPGKPEPTPINEIRQSTMQDSLNTLAVECSEDFQDDAEGKLSKEAALADLTDQIEELIRETQEDAMSIAMSLADQIAGGAIEVETRGRDIIIRIKEQGSFASGSDELNYAFIPIVTRISGTLLNKKGNITIEGHTDDRPISTARFQSNWSLSSARASTVAHYLFEEPRLDQNRFTVSGFSSNKPLVNNDTPENRSKNRRVEIVIHQGMGKNITQKLEVLKAEDRAAFDDLDQRFNLNPDEIF
ncbi:MAG: flagellar motor protein MotB [Pseudomonadales bacterium]|nr:flagellar motor protein MotB [Pseudomonadales bacterium]